MDFGEFWGSFAPSVLLWNSGEGAFPRLGVSPQFSHLDTPKTPRFQPKISSSAEKGGWEFGGSPPSPKSWQKSGSKPPKFGIFLVVFASPRRPRLWGGFWGGFLGGFGEC